MSQLKIIVLGFLMSVFLVGAGSVVSRELLVNSGGVTFVFTTFYFFLYGVYSVYSYHTSETEEEEVSATPE